jgi:acyl dehydratase
MILVNTYIFFSNFIKNIKINKMLQLGEKYIYKFSYTQEQVNAFAEVTGDNNPVHLDKEYAEKTIFKRPIAHGMLGASILSKVFGTIFPGEGTIYLNQTLNFLRPMFVDQEYEAVFEVKEIIADKNKAIISTTIQNNEGKSVLTGEATIMNIEQIK